MKSRILLDYKKTYYHCMTRTVHGERWLDEEARAVLRKMLWRVAQFSGVEVLTYCLMGNHLHLLVEVPPKEEQKRVDDAELLRRFAILYGDQPARAYGMLTVKGAAEVFANGGVVAEQLRAALQARMCDLAIFMETLKVRFTRWYNHRHNTFGTLWAARYKSVIIEGSTETLREVAAYIDLNPVRAGMVSDPALYPFSGYGEARDGGLLAWRGILRLMGSSEGDTGVEAIFRRYTLHLYARGSVSGGEGKGGCIPLEIVRAVLGETTMPEASPMGFAKDWGRVVCGAFLVGRKRFLEANAKVIAGLLGRKRAVKSGYLSWEGESESETQDAWGYFNQKL